MLHITKKNRFSDTFPSISRPCFYWPQQKYPHWKTTTSGGALCSLISLTNVCVRMPLFDLVLLICYLYSFLSLCLYVYILIYAMAQHPFLSLACTQQEFANIIPRANTFKDKLLMLITWLFKRFVNSYALFSSKEQSKQFIPSATFAAQEICLSSRSKLGIAHEIQILIGSK